MTKLECWVIGGLLRYMKFLWRNYNNTSTDPSFIMGYQNRCSHWFFTAHFPLVIRSYSLIIVKSRRLYSWHTSTASWKMKHSYMYVIPNGTIPWFPRCHLSFPLLRMGRFWFLLARLDHWIFSQWTSWTDWWYFLNSLPSGRQMFNLLNVQLCRWNRKPH